MRRLSDSRGPDAARALVTANNPYDFVFASAFAARNGGHAPPSLPDTPPGTRWKIFPWPSYYDHVAREVDERTGRPVSRFRGAFSHIGAQSGGAQTPHRNLSSADRIPAPVY